MDEGKSAEERPLRSNMLVTWLRFKKNRLAVVGLLVILVLATIALAAPWLSPHDRDALNLRNRFKSPSSAHWLGTDDLGRDVLTRLMWGGRISLTVGLVSVSISLTIGVLMGSVAGYFGGMVDNVIMRLTDVFLSFPSLVLMILLATVFKPGIYTTMLAIGLVGWTRNARLVRGEFLSLRQRDFTEAARALGAAHSRLIFRHLLPNSLAPIIVSATLGVATAILAEAGLSFLGMGVQTPIPSWGNMLNTAMKMRVLIKYPFIWIPPGICIFVAVMSINLVGDGLRDALDPRLKT